MDFIHVEGVSKAYADHHVLNELTLDIHKGECFTLLGPSGCGKSTLIDMILQEYCDIVYSISCTTRTASPYCRL